MRSFDVIGVEALFDILIWSFLRLTENTHLLVHTIYRAGLQKFNSKLFDHDCALEGLRLSLGLGEI